VLSGGVLYACRAIIFAFLIFVANDAASAQQRAPTENGAYDLAITVTEGGVSIRGSWSLPEGAVQGQTFEFLLTRLVVRPDINVWCGPSVIGLSNLSGAPGAGDQRWRAELEQSCTGQSVVVRFAYALNGVAAPQLRTSATDGFAGGFGEIWYPQLSYALRETGRISFDAPQDLQVIATGRGGRITANGRARFNFEINTPSKLAFAYGPYRTRDTGGVFPVRIMTLSDGAGAERVRDTIARSIGPLIEAFGPPPVHSLAIVDIDFQSPVLGSSEFGMLFVDRSQMASEAGALDYWAHELAHQWWGVSLRANPRSPGATMLTEGMAQYGALWAIERAQGEEAAARYRRNGARHSLAVYSQLMARDKDTIALAAFLAGDQSETLLGHRVATSKGALVLDLFAREFGRDRFHAVLMRFFSGRRGESASWDELEQALRSEFGERSERFLDQWLHRPGLPALSVAWQPIPGGVELDVEQLGQVYNLTLPITLETVHGSITRTLELDRRRYKFTVHAPETMNVIIDPLAHIPMTAPVLVRRGRGLRRRSEAASGGARGRAGSAC
jgi:hypothetical protein